MIKNTAQKLEGGLRLHGQYKKSENHYPLLTIIVAVFNGKDLIEDTITSVLNQTYRNIELIIIDGNSTDGTQKILLRYEHAIDYWISETDKNISDAFNKGVKLARGDYINFQGAGDYLVNADVVTQILKNIDPQSDMLVCGRVQRVSASKDNIVRSIIPKQFKRNFVKTSLLFKMSLPHQALLTNKKMFNEFGLFDVNNTFCMDYDFLLRAYKKFPQVILKDIIFSAWREGGIGTGKILEIYREYNQIKIKNKIACSFCLKVINIYILFKYYCKKALLKWI